MRHKRFLTSAAVLLLSLTAVLFTSCRNRKSESLELENPNRELELLTTQETATDKWVKENFTDPYNINAIWRWNYKETGYDKNFIPPHEENVIPFLTAVNHTFLQGYEEHKGKNWFLPLVPKQLLLLGEWGYNTNGTITLGQAEAGQKIVFYGVDHWNARPDLGYPNVREAIHTMFHEFGHVLHQNKMFSEDFQKITPEGYTSTWNNESEVDSRIAGYVSSYSRLNQNEDFVELIAFYTTLSQENWESLVNEGVEHATNQLKKAQNGGDAKKISDATILLDKALTGRVNINRKIAMVKEYLKSQWSIDIDDLREIVLRRSEEFFKNPEIFPKASGSSVMSGSLRSATPSDVQSPFVHNCRHCAEHNHAPAPTKVEDPKTLQ